MGAAFKIDFDHSRKLEMEDLVDFLIQDSFLEPLRAKMILNKTKNYKHHPLITLADEGIIDRANPHINLSLDKLSQWYASKIGMEYIKIDPLRINMEVVSSLVPFAYAKRLSILPLAADDRTATFAVCEPFDLAWVKELTKVIKKEIILKFASPIQIKHLLEEIFVVQKEIKKMAAVAPKEHQRLIKQGKFEELDRLIEKSKQKTAGTTDNSVVRIVDWMLNFAYSERASDIHLEPKKGMAHIRFRVDGVLRVVYKMDPEAMLNVISRIKILGDMKLDEKRKPQDGRVKRFLENGKKIEMRLSTVPSFYGEKMVIRIFDQAVAGVDLGFIGFNPEDLKTWTEMINQTQGLILVTGPTGSGKTTTLYTSLNLISTEEVNVCTVEDPIEMTVDTFNQVQVNSSIGLNFAECVRSFLRQDPDVIMVGEIRDLETGEIAIQSSLTGHLVFSTLHTNGALATIQRLLDIGLQSYLINSSLTCILAQRLVRKLCTTCKKQVPIDMDKWMSLLDGEILPIPSHTYEAVGCEDCKNTGYSGRMCVYELVKFTDQIKKTITANIDITVLKEKTKGMYTPFRVNAARKVIEGTTSIDEVLKVAF
jgi:general secretion pathway protein E